MKKMIKLSLILTSMFLFLRFTIVSPAKGSIKEKLNLIEIEIKKMGYNPNWVVISEKRTELVNNLLPLSAKKGKSYHLKGMAIDIFVFDVNGDNKFDIKDVKIIETANNTVERKTPKLKGGFGTYMNKGYLNKHMIHLDTRGYHHRYY